jgi:hypothetical protein
MLPSFSILDFGLGAAAADILVVVVFVFGLVYLRYAFSEAGQVERRIYFIIPRPFFLRSRRLTGTARP